MPLQKIFDSSAEEKVNVFLNELINTEYYRIESQLCMSSVFSELVLDNDFEKMYTAFCHLMNRPDLKNIKYTHALFDFVIYEKISNLPVLILEVNGRKHISNISKRNLDLFKQFMAGKNDIPFITLKLYFSYSDEEIKALLESQLKSVDNLYELPQYCSSPYCQSRLKVRQRKDKNYFYFCPACTNASGNNITYSPERFPSLLKP